MTFKEFCRWANERACDGQWGLQHIIATNEIYAVMDNVKFFKERFWKKNCEARAIKIVESVNRIKEQLKGNRMIELKDLVATFSATYEIHIYDEKDNEKLFSCQTDSKALEHYGDWIVRDISFVPSVFGCSYGGVKVYIREVEE